MTPRIADAYHWLLVPFQPQANRPVTWDVVRADGAKEQLAERASDKLCQADLLRIVHGACSIRYDLDNRLASVWQRGRIKVGDLCLDAFGIFFGHVAKLVTSGVHFAAFIQFKLVRQHSALRLPRCN